MKANIPSNTATAIYNHFQKDPSTTE